MWAVDFQFDVTTDGRPIKIVSVIDEHTRECLGGLVERSITGENLINELDRLAGQRGTYPAVLRCDNGPELASGAMADWAQGQVGMHFIPPGEPWRNGYVESFNSRIRDECLIFRTDAGGIGCGAMCLGSQEASSGLRACSQDLVEEGVAEGEFSRIADEPVTHFVHHVPVSDAGVWIGESE